VNLELAGKDRLPLHASLEWNNQGTPDTPSHLGLDRFTNVFNKDQILTSATQTPPPHLGDVQVYGLSYVIPLKQSGRTIAFYGAKSRASVVAGGSVSFSGSANVAGNSSVLGGRYIFPVGTGEKLAQQVSLGIDYIRLESELAFPGQAAATNLTNALNYLPLSVNYTALRLNGGSTNISAGSGAMSPAWFRVGTRKISGGSVGPPKHARPPWLDGTLLSSAPVWSGFKICRRGLRYR
jgi:hypothetical protein